MFGSKPKSPTTEVAQEKPVETKKAPKTLSVIAEGIQIGGELKGAGDVQLDGNFTGQIKCNALTIGKTGHMDGIVEAEQVTILGSLKGEIRAKKVRLQHSAEVTGDVYHDVLEVAAGAKIEGRYSRKMAIEKKVKADKVETGSDGKKEPVQLKEVSKTSQVAE